MVTNKNPESDTRRKEVEDHEKKEEALDETLAETFPASDPPSSIPDPDEDESAA